MAEYEWFTEEQKEVHKIQSLLLKEIYSVSSRPVFKGGTALEMVFGLDRFSEDLDFETETNDIADIDEAIENMDSRIMSVENDWESEIIRHANMHVYVLNFYSAAIGARVSIKIDAVFDRCMLKPKKKTINVDGRPLTMEVMDEREILAEKVTAIMNERRNQPRDLYDLKFLMEKNIEVNLHLIYMKSKSSVFGDAKKYSIEGFKGRVYALEDVWSKLRPYLRELPAFRGVADYVIGKMKEIS